MEVVRMTPAREKAHLGKLLDKVAKAESLLVKTLGKAGHGIQADVIYRDTVETYKFFKKAYQL